MELLVPKVPSLATRAAEFPRDPTQTLPGHIWAFWRAKVRGHPPNSAYDVMTASSLGTESKKGRFPRPLFQGKYVPPQVPYVKETNNHTLERLKLQQPQSSYDYLMERPSFGSCVDANDHKTVGR